MTKGPLRVISLTNQLLRYRPSLELQERLVAERKAGTAPDTLLVVQVCRAMQAAVMMLVIVPYAYLRYVFSQRTFMLSVGHCIAATVVLLLLLIYDNSITLSSLLVKEGPATTS